MTFTASNQVLFFLTFVVFRFSVAYAGEYQPGANLAPHEGEKFITSTSKIQIPKKNVRRVGTKKNCDPRSSIPSNRDHYAHSDPGIYPSYGGAYVDSMNRGFVTVTLDGSGSHSHAQVRGRNAQIISYKWLLSNGRVISTAKKFTYRFPIGTTKLRLVVQDEVCTTNGADTAVTVTGTRGSGADCYYYPGHSSAFRVGTLYRSPFPAFASIQPSLFLKIPLELKNKNFVMRCKFLLQILQANSKISIDTGGAGTAYLYSGTQKIVDTRTRRTSAPLGVKTTMLAFELLYVQKARATKPVIRLTINGFIPQKVYFDHSRVLPILKSLSPTSGRTSGGTVVRIVGYGLNPPVTILFGSQKVFISQNRGSYGEVLVNAPSVGRPMTVSVKVQRSKTIFSSAVMYKYVDTCDDVAFERTYMKDSSGGNLHINQPTAITTASDGSLYIGTKKGEIIVVKYDEISLKVRSKCSSGIFVDQKWKNARGVPLERSILGITLDPRDITPRPYISVSTLFWNKWNPIKNGLVSGGWANGAVERFKPASSSTKARFPGRCLEHDKTISRNLPVSNADHAINELLFTANGDLLVAVGGNTNMGLPHKDLGGLWETYFSGSVVIIRLSKGNSFNGVIPYNSVKNMRTAKPRNGYTDVNLYSTGLRNLFSMIMTRAGKVLGVDMGSNCNIGNAAALCSEYDESEAAKRSPNSNSFIGGKAIVYDRFCKNKFSAHQRDKFVEIKQGKFYGHPNLQRARLRNTPGECAYVDSNTDKTAPPLKRKPPSNYQSSIALLKSPKTGIREYGANCFCGKLRGHIILANEKSHGTSAIRPNGAKTNPDLVQIAPVPVGGLRVDENIHGDLLFPELDKGGKSGILVLRPKVRLTNSLRITNAIPFRHGRRGGTIIRIGGTGFSSKSVVLIGGKNCIKTAVSARTISCRVPAANRGGQQASIEVRNNGEKQTLTNAVLYMNV